ncbi:MAG: aromatic ring-hydroxylating dioxygenase subunit alpha [Acidimicrobiales bacterium]
MTSIDYEQLKADLDRYHLEGTTATVDHSWRQPSSAYCSAERLAREQRRIFDRLPLVAARSSEVGQPDAFVSRSVVGTPLLLVRQADGTARAFLNACRHRSVEVVADGQSGCSRRFTCPYHGWTYNGEGALVGLPGRDAFDDLDPGDLGLAEVACAERHGLIFVARRPDVAIDLPTFLGPMDGVLSEVGLDTYVVERTIDLEVEANWKLVVDGFLETYHVRYLHGASLKDVLIPDRSAHDRLGPHGRLATPKLTYDPASHHRPDELYAQLSMNYRLFPNTMLTWFTDHFEMWQIEPDLTRPNRTTIRMSLLVRPEDLGRTRKWDTNATMSLDVITGEDFVAATSTQRTLDGHAAPEWFVYGRNEPGVQHFHQSVLACLDDGVSSYSDATPNGEDR